MKRIKLKKINISKIIKKLKKIKLTKKGIIALTGLLIVLILILVLFFNSRFYDYMKFKHSYQTLNNEISEGKNKYPEVKIPFNFKIDYVSANTVIKKLDKGDSVIYIGSPKDIYSRDMIEILIDEAKSQKLKKIYYLDIDKIKSEKAVENGEIVTVKKGSKSYYKLLDKLGNRLTSIYLIRDDNGNIYNTKEDKIDLPLVLFIKDGKIVSYNIKTLQVHDNPYEKLDKYQLKDLRDIYKYGIKDVLKK